MSKQTSVEIIQAQNLKAGKSVAVLDQPLQADLNGKSDPYVLFYLRDGTGHASKQHRTRTIKKNLNPYWDENFVCDSKDEEGNLIFQVYDHDSWSHDDIMCDLPNLITHLQWYC
jgi:Ca2+-dependent lipid-binding protein